MAFDTWMYLPIDEDESTEVPTIENIIQKIVDHMNSSKNKEEEEPKEEEGEDNYRRYGRNNDTPQKKALDAYFKKDENWSMIYSFSFGASNPVGDNRSPSMSSYNIMRKHDRISPLLLQMVISGDSLRHAVILCVRLVKDTLKVIEISMNGCEIESIQWSGSSGGDSTPTESLSICTNEWKMKRVNYDIVTGEIKSDYRCEFDTVTKKSKRTKLREVSVPKLASLAKGAVVGDSAVKVSDETKGQLEELGIISESESNRMKKAPRGVKLLYTDNLTDKKFNLFSVPEVTVENIKKGIEEKHGKAPKAVYCLMRNELMMKVDEDKVAKDNVDEMSFLVAEF